MHRDMDLIRDILLAIEQDDGDPDVEIELILPGRLAIEISYHVRLLSEAGFVHAQDLSVLGHGADGFLWLPTSLTFRGHEFLDTIREKEIWRQTKETAKKGGAETLGFFWEIAKALVKRELQKRTGLEF